MFLETSVELFHSRCVLRMVYVSEQGNHCVSVFTSEGQYLMSFGNPIDLCPHGLAVGP